jgi:3-mercaptopyruvate sulfurtransferase SseA
VSGLRHLLALSTRSQLDHVLHPSSSRSSIGAPRQIQQQPRRSMAAASGAAARLVQPAEAAAMMKDEGYKMVDVRTPEEFGAGHSPGAVNVAFMLKGAGGAMAPNAAFAEQFKAACPDTSAKLLIVRAFF